MGSTPNAIDPERLDDGAILVLRIDRPRRGNALDSRTPAEPHRLLDSNNGDPAVRAVVRTGSARCSAPEPGYRPVS